MAVAILTCSEQARSREAAGDVPPFWGLRENDIGEGRDSSGQPWACHPVFLLASWTPAPERRTLLTDKAKKTCNFLFEMG